MLNKSILVFSALLQYNRFNCVQAIESLYKISPQSIFASLQITFLNKATIQIRSDTFCSLKACFQPQTPLRDNTPGMVREISSYRIGGMFEWVL